MELRMNMALGLTMRTGLRSDIYLKVDIGLRTDTVLGWLTMGLRLEMYLEFGHKNKVIYGAEVRHRHDLEVTQCGKIL